MLSLSIKLLLKAIGSFLLVNLLYSLNLITYLLQLALFLYEPTHAAGPEPFIP
jgi:hypothetical protein